MREVDGFFLVVAKGGLKAKPYSAPTEAEKSVALAFAASTTDGLINILRASTKKA